MFIYYNQMYPFLLRKTIPTFEIQFEKCVKENKEKNNPVGACMHILEAWTKSTQI